MAILTQDIKILKSAVMNDATNGGGRMTGVAVVDGQSNSLFPDTSAMDRAFGRVQMRKVFGVAHTNDTDTLMGAHTIITDTPDDPNVHCTLMKTSNWGDQRDSAKELIERYLVKGPRMSWRIYDTHYEGSAKLRLYAFTNLQPPASGESLCLINPNGQELYVRVLRIKEFQEKVYLQEENGVIEATANLLECDLSQTLATDIYGPPVFRVGINEHQYAIMYSTTLANGVKFYGTKALELNAATGDYSVTTDDGIFTPLVPAATIETAVVDQYPLRDRKGVSSTGLAAIQTEYVQIIPDAITMPTPVMPKTLQVLNNGNELCKDVGGGEIKNSSDTLIARIDYTTGIITFVQKSAVAGYALYFRYTPASQAAGTTRSDLITIDAINQGLAFTKNLLPLPAPMTLSISYMAQGRWYTLTDNGIGKLSGGDTSYGTASVNYATGSLSLTLGALPDVGSVILFEWGGTNGVQPIASASLPTHMSTRIELGTKRVSPSTVKFALPNGAAPVFGLNNSGQSTDPNQVVRMIAAGSFELTPSHVSQLGITVEWQEYVDATTQVVTSTVANEFFLPNAPITAGSVSFHIALTLPVNHVEYYGATQLHATDKNGRILITVYYRTLDIGSIDYVTGKVTINAAITLSTIESVNKSRTVGLNTDVWVEKVFRNETAVAIAPIQTTVTTSAGSLSDVKTLTVIPQWYVQLASNLLTDGIAAFVVNKLYTGKNGTLYTDWNYATGTGTANGTVTREGLFKPVLVQTGTVPNVVTWHNAATSSTEDKVTAGVFRTVNAPLKQGVFQLTDDLNRVLEVNVDAQRGIVRWSSGASASVTVKASALRYNTVYLEYLPLEASILGLNTARLPLDGKVPVFRSGDLCVIHNTLTLELPNPLVKGTAYTMRERLASVRVKDALGVVVPDTKYELELNAGKITFPTGISITSYAQPFSVEHRIEDLLLCSQADISGRLRFTRSLTHNFPADTSYVSSALPFGDLFARFYNVVEQQTWTNVWSDDRIGSALTANFNETDYPIFVSNRGTIKERWAVIFTGSTTFRVVGESVGEIGYGNTSDDCAPTNNATSAPYFVIPALGWGAGWSVGNVLRFNTDACGTPFWIVRTILQGPASVESDKFALAFRGDVDRP